MTGPWSNRETPRDDPKLANSQCPSTKQRPPKSKVLPLLLLTRRYADMLLLKAKLKAREEHVRESWVLAMEARIVRDNLNKCQKIEGVNHYEKCKHLAERYQEMLRDNRVSVNVIVPRFILTSVGNNLGEGIQGYRPIAL